MSFRIPFLSIAATLVGTLSVSACGLGSSADIGDDTSNQRTSTGGADSSSGGAASASGGAASTGGATSSGGAATGGEKCGKNTCAVSEYCCNESCGICAPEGGGCIELACNGDCGDHAPCVPGSIWDEITCECVPSGNGCQGGIVPCPSGSVWSKVSCSCESTGGCQGGIVPCPSGAEWSTVTCACVPKASACTTNADCRLEANYCGGCNCLALSKSQKAPVCEGNEVNCFAEPCGAEGKTTAVCVAGACVAK